MSPLKVVISGGQTGVDRKGLEAARDAGFGTGGTAPKDFLTEKGFDISLKDFGLVEHRESGYSARTLKNVLDSDGSVLFGNMSSPGSLQTVQFCIKHNKPYLTNPGARELVDWITKHKIHILNVAGNRGSRLTLARQDEIYQTLLSAFLMCK